jgi:hypothetical protein
MLFGPHGICVAWVIGLCFFRLRVAGACRPRQGQGARLFGREGNLATPRAWKGDIKDGRPVPWARGAGFFCGRREVFFLPQMNTDEIEFRSQKQ